MKLTLKQMHYFDALARSLHFGKAAASVNISQPALSAQIMDMEARLERKLVERRHGKVVLTEAGQRLLPHIRRILGDVQSLEEMVSQDRGLLVGNLRVGMIPTIAPYLLPKLIPHLQARFPKLDLKVREAITDTLTRELVEGQLDAIVAAEPIAEAGLHTEHLFRDRFFIASAANGADVLHSPLAEDQVALDRFAPARRRPLPARPGAGGLRQGQGAPARQFRRHLDDDPAATGFERPWPDIAAGNRYPGRNRASAQPDNHAIRRSRAAS